MSNCKLPLVRKFNSQLQTASQFDAWDAWLPPHWIVTESGDMYIPVISHSELEAMVHLVR